ncbi:MAG: hypothetical protein SGJ13_01170 [Actinomycetota bacterium]|nr:hypothetical protein [Actinomycetota bacterium]
MRRHDRAAVREQDAGRVADLARQPLFPFGVVDAAVLVDERELAVEDARVLVQEPRHSPIAASNVA